jgi:hypothetical protein
LLATMSARAVASALSASPTVGLERGVVLGEQEGDPAFFIPGSSSISLVPVWDDMIYSLCARRLHSIANTALTSDPNRLGAGEDLVPTTGISGYLKDRG